MSSKHFRSLSLNIFHALPCEDLDTDDMPAYLHVPLLYDPSGIDHCGQEDHTGSSY